MVQCGAVMVQCKTTRKHDDGPVMVQCWQSDGGKVTHLNVSYSQFDIFEIQNLKKGFSVI